MRDRIAVLNRNSLRNETRADDPSLRRADKFGFKPLTLQTMGKGDMKTKKGKRTAGSRGKSRPSKRTVATAKKAAAKKAAPKKKAAKKAATKKKAAPKKKAAKKK